MISFSSWRSHARRGEPRSDRGRPGHAPPPRSSERGIEVGLIPVVGEAVDICRGGDRKGVLPPERRRPHTDGQRLMSAVGFGVSTYWRGAQLAAVLPGGIKTSKSARNLSLRDLAVGQAVPACLESRSSGALSSRGGPGRRCRAYRIRTTSATLDAAKPWVQVARGFHDKPLAGCPENSKDRLQASRSTSLPVASTNKLVSERDEGCRGRSRRHEQGNAEVSVDPDRVATRAGLRSARHRAPRKLAIRVGKPFSGRLQRRQMG